MNENWCTLAIAVLYERPCTIEQAFELYNKGNIAKNNPKPKGKEDIEDMVKFRKQGFKFKEIAEIFCMDPSTICNLVNKKSFLQEAKHLNKNTLLKF